MSRIDDLIAKLCPEGVTFEELGGVGEFIRGRRFTKQDYVEHGLGAIHYGEIYTHYGTSATTARSYVRPELKDGLRLAKTGDLVIAATGENVKDVCKAVAWIGDEEIAIHDDCYIYRHRLDPRYVSYFFQSSAFRDQKVRFVSESKVVRISGASMAKIRIPVPPLQVQREIVRVLAGFESLEAELEAELEARGRQHQHYRNRIVGSIRGERVRLDQLGQWFGGVTPSKAEPRYWDGGQIPWLASMDVSDSSANDIRGRITPVALAETSLRLIPPPSVAVVMRSNILRRRLPVGLITVATTVNQDMRALVPRNGVDAAFVYHVLSARSEELRSGCVRTDGSMAAVDSKSFFAVEIDLPSYQEQIRIAEKCRAFDTLVNDLSIGLPAELNARRKQYEHYRDRLLTFQEAA